MKLEIPEKLKEDVPHSMWGRILMATPVVLTVIATMLAGLSSSEMTRAQYDRSLAAQLQSKAGDQWNFFQAKRLRSSMQGASADTLFSEPGSIGFEPALMEKTIAPLASAPDSLAAEMAGLKAELIAWWQLPAARQAAQWLQGKELPSPGRTPTADPLVAAAVSAVEAMKPESEIIPLVAGISDRSLEEALRQAKDQVHSFDAVIKPLQQAIDQGNSLLMRLKGRLTAAATPSAPAPIDLLFRSFTLARMRCNAQRYEIEARLNQAVAYVYELQVRRWNLSADRHHTRSQRFFLGMLAAQLGVIVSTFAIAARQKNFLWGLAATAGLIAVLFTVYVYLFI